MKEIRRAIEFYRKRVRSTFIACPIFILMMTAIAIWVFSSMPQIWWIGVIPLIFACVVLICFVFFFRSTRKKLHRLEEELREAEKLNQQSQNTK